MNKKLEGDFVNTYIVKNKRERLLFELQGKKRSEAIGRFCHRTDELLMLAVIKAKGPYILDEIEARIRTSGTDACYVISFFPELDGKVFRKKEIMEKIIGLGMPSIAVFVDFAIIETEQEQGPAVKYLLEK